MPTKIEWAEETWNPVTGCTPISEGCHNCYAERMSHRLAGRAGYPASPNQFDVTLHPDRLEQPLGWKKPRRIFVVSMGDLFHEDVDVEFQAKVWYMMGRTPQHTYIVLTKRPELMKWFVDLHHGMRDTGFLNPPLPNVWLGVTIEKPEYSYRAQYLRNTPAAVRFISFEPLLASMSEYPGVLDDMDWVICGGESGPGARPMHPDWARGLRHQCQEADVPFFFKQWGAWGLATDHPISDRAPAGFWRNHKWQSGLGYQRGDETLMVRVGKHRAGRLLDGREWNEYPEIADG